MDESGLQVSRKAVLVVLFVPSVERDGATAIDQDYWVGAALETLGEFTAAPPLSRAPVAFGAMTSGVVYWSRMSRSSFTATPRSQTSPTRIASVGLGVSAEG